MGAKIIVRSNASPVGWANNLFKRNIYIGHPNFHYKKQFDVYIPVKIPNIDSQGLVVRPDGLGVEKLDKKIESNYKTINEILSLIDD